MHLFVITSESELLYSELLRQQQLGPISVVVTSQKDAADMREKSGIRPIVIPITRIEDSDELFSERCMPGVLDRYILDEFPAWKSLGMDRLKFWFSGDESWNFMYVLDFLDVSAVTVSLDINSWVPWEVMSWATAQGLPTTLVKTHFVRTPECYRAVEMFKPDRLIVTYDDEADLYSGISSRTEVISKLGPRPKRRPVSKERREGLRAGLAIPEDMYLTGIIYDKRDEWAYLRLVNLIKDTGKLSETLIFPYDNRSEELFYKSIPHHVPYGMLCDRPELLEMCDEIVMFRYIEGVMQIMPDIPVAIYDFYDRRMSQKLAYDVKAVFP